MILDELNNSGCFSMTLAIDFIDRHGPSKEMRHQLQPKKTKVIKAVLAVYIATKDVLSALYY